MTIYNFHNSSLRYHCKLTASLERLKDNPVDDNDRNVIDAAVKMTDPIEMLNDLKERHRYASTATIYMCWIMVPTAPPEELDRLVVGSLDFRVRKVKGWPVINPSFYELHIEEDN